ncbi:MAG: hypothetical protein EPO26_18210 [Chloroflexota bacterium]|nr:MAG: hypothetical protein EPO26_18210 [Chloroflexota bacterium]
MAINSSTGAIADAAGASGRATASDVIAARRAAALIGPDSPLRPGRDTPRPSLEFVGALGRLGETFQEIRASLRGIESKVDAVGQSVIASRGDLNAIHDRVNLVTGRVDNVDERFGAIEERQTVAIESMQAQIATLTRQVGLAVGLSLVVVVVSALAVILAR